MSKIQILFTSVFLLIVSIIASCFLYTKEIRGIISNKYYLIISFLVLLIIINFYYSEVSKRDADERKDLKYMASFSISLFTIIGIVFSMHILLFIIEWIKSMFN